MKTKLTREQLAAVISFANDNGRNWKSELRDSWMTVNYAGRQDGNYLQQVRNQFGPTWLVNFKLPKDVGNSAAVLLDKFSSNKPFEYRGHKVRMVKTSNRYSRSIYIDDVCRCAYWATTKSVAKAKQIIDAQEAAQ